MAFHLERHDAMLAAHLDGHEEVLHGRVGIRHRKSAQCGSRLLIEAIRELADAEFIAALERESVWVDKLPVAGKSY